MKIDFGPVFVATSRDGKRHLVAWLKDKHSARLIKSTVLDVGIRSELPEKERLALFSGHSSRGGLASSAEVDKQPGLGCAFVIGHRRRVSSQPPHTMAVAIGQAVQNLDPFPNFGRDGLSVKRLADQMIEQGRGHGSEFRALLDCMWRDEDGGRDLLIVLTLLAPRHEGADLIERMQSSALHGLSAVWARRFCFTRNDRA